MKLSILIISYKSIAKIQKCLANLGELRKIVVVENSSNIEIKNEIEKKFNNCKVILNYKNFGFATAVNIGLKEINSQFVILLNSDVEINHQQLIDIENEITNNESFALASPLSDDLIDFNKNNILDKYLENSEINPVDKKNITKVDQIKGASIIINLDKFKTKKIFDENFFFFFEEIDLCRRLKEANENIYVFNKIKIKHIGAQGIGKNDERLVSNYIDFRHWNFFWGRFYYYKKHYGYLYALLKHISKLLRFFINILRYYFLSTVEYKKNKYRFLGLFASMIGIKSSYSDKILNKK